MTPPTVHLITDTDRRGAQVFAQQLVSHLEAGQPDSHRLVAIRDTLGGLDVETLPESAPVPALRAIAGAGLVVAHGSATLDLCARAVPGRFVYRSIGDPAYWGRRIDRRIKTGLLLRRARRVVALWPGAASALTDRYRVAPDRITVSPNAIEPPAHRSSRAGVRAALAIPDDARLAIHLGALSWEKRVHLVIEAIAPTDLHLLCVGDGPRRDELRLLASTLAPGRVHFAGSVPDPAGLVAAADVMAIASVTEGVPAAALEALALGVPVVASPVGGLPDLASRATGLRLVDPTSTPELSHALAEPVPTPPGLPGDHTLHHVAATWQRLLGTAEVPV